MRLSMPDWVLATLSPSLLAIAWNSISSPWRFVSRPPNWRARPCEHVGGHSASSMLYWPSHGQPLLSSEATTGMHGWRGHIDQPSKVRFWDSAAFLSRLGFDWHLDMLRTVGAHGCETSVTGATGSPLAAEVVGTDQPAARHSHCTRRGSKARLRNGKASAKDRSGGRAGERR